MKPRVSSSFYRSVLIALPISLVLWAIIIGAAMLIIM